MPYSVHVTLEENKIIEVSGDEESRVRILVNDLTEKFFPNTPWVESDI